MYGIIERNTNVNIQYKNQSDLIITTDLFVMNPNQTEIYEFCGTYSGITIPKAVKIIKERAFENIGITRMNFEIDSQLLEIENYAFINCSKLNSLDFSQTILNDIGIESFKNCTILTTVTFALTNLVIKKNAFANCVNLENVKNILSIPNGCFSECAKLKNVNILENSKLIGSKSFENCYLLENINIPSNVQFISEYAFINCIKLKSIIFVELNSLANISKNSFSGCDSLKNISNFSSSKYKCIDNTLYYINESNEYLIFHLNHSLDNSLCINCTVICSYSFNECNNIYNISILSESVKLIEKYSFINCLHLQYINFPLSVQIVETHAFKECQSIRCPLIIENTKLDYLKMIISSGIPRQLVISCGVYHDSNKLQSIKRYRNASAIFLFGQLSK